MDLDSARRALLDLSTRNRLLALPSHQRARAVLPVAETDPADLAARLMAGHRLTLRPKGARGADGLALDLPAAELPRRLRNLLLDARTAREETGVSCLFLALGALAWRDPATPGTERLAPLCLLPVALEQGPPGQPFRLRAGGGPIQGNECLAEKLRVTFGLAVEPVEAEEASLASFGGAIAEAVMGQPGFRLRPEVMALGLFAFDRFLMWRDLDEQANPGLRAHPILRQLLGADPVPPAALPEGEVDALIPVERLDLAVPLDGSQTLAVEAVRRGQSLVIQGPPGTGKSQVISAIIAQAVLDGRSVVFLAEKQAALEVVQRRLAGLGLGAAVLPLHDPDASRPAALAAIREAMDPGPAPPELALLGQREAIIGRLGALRARLARHAAAMGGTIGRSGLTLAEVTGSLARRRAAGQPPCPIGLPAGEWDAGQIALARGLAAELAERARHVGAAAIWRGVGRPLTPLEQDRLLAALPGWLRALSAAAADQRLAALGPRGLAELPPPGPDLPPPPPHDPAGLAHPAWRHDLDVETLGALAEHAAAREEAYREPSMRPGAETLEDLAWARSVLSRPGSLFDFLSPARGKAKRIARLVSNQAEAPLAALNAALRIQQADAFLKRHGALGAAAFGRLWGGPAEAMRALVGWRRTHGPAALDALEAPRPAIDTGLAGQARAAIEALLGATGLDLAAAFGTEDPPLPQLARRLADWAAAGALLPVWLGWQQALARMPELAPLAALLEQGRLAPEQAGEVVEQAIEEGLFTAALRADPSLAAFDGTAADRLSAEFRATDAARIALARAETIAAHRARAEAALRERPEAALLRAEMEKKRGHLPLRALIARTAPALFQLKPVLMMSPLSVARFLAPPHGLVPGVSVDLLVMDEASQIEPVDALGAIGRARQVVVVGDDRQMPPTRFFASLAEADAGEAGEEEAPLAPDQVESILGLMNARGMPSAMLRWHYRSRHESLIATSNAEFYDDRLIVPPSPAPRSAALGLSMVRVQGRYEGRVNRAEAQAIAWAVLDHARRSPGESLGVVAFSLPQRDAILDALEEARATAPETEPFFAAHAQEPFFVKNLETVQGDERDAMLLSIGYGPDGAGNFPMRFGPLTAEGGERRLNVLITRAKRRMVVFASFGAEQLDLTRTASRGVAALARFLALAGQDLTAPGAAPPPATPLAALMGAQLARAGFGLRGRVGTGPASLELAATAPDGACLLGIGTDGADWARLPSARDREIGLPQALEGMGWRLHRAWHLAWFAQPGAETQRLLAALGAPAGPAQAAMPAPLGAPAPDPGLAEPYREARPQLPEEPLASLPFASLALLVSGIVAVEQPVHGEAIIERLAIARGGAALTGGERQAVMQALSLARQFHKLQESNGFWRVDGTPVPPRDRRGVAAHLRHPVLLPPEEVEEAARRLLQLRPQSTEGELVSGILRLLGLEEEARPAIAARVAMLVGAGRIAVLA